MRGEPLAPCADTEAREVGLRGDTLRRTAVRNEWSFAELAHTNPCIGRNVPWDPLRNRFTTAGLRRFEAAGYKLCPPLSPKMTTVLRPAVRHDYQYAVTPFRGSLTYHQSRSGSGV